MTLQEASKNINRNVIYTPFERCDSSLREVGTITSVNSKFVFVRYSYSNNGIATSPEDLELEIKKEYSYTYKLRGFSIGCQPKDGFIRHENRDYDYGIIFYTRELTKIEIEDYELIKIKEEQSL